MKLMWIAVLLFASAVQAQTIVQRVADDAIVFDRVAQAAKGDLPGDLLKRMAEEDVDLLRGKRADGSYEYATYERFDAGRVMQSFSIDVLQEKMKTVEVKGDFVYRVQLEVPGKRMFVRKNRPVWIERVELEYVAVGGSSQTERQSIEIKQWMQPGEFRPVDLPVVARQATARVVTAVDKGGYGNLEVSLVKAKIVDNADSPYAEALANLKGVQRAIESRDIASMRTTAQRLRSSLGAAPVAVAAAVAAPKRAESTIDVMASPSTSPATKSELEAIEDLLTGSEPERREGMDRLHQLIRRMRQ
jgi:hypothetical protein